MTLAAQFAAAVMGTVAFSLLFGVPRRFYPYCGLIGGAGWLLYCILTRWMSAAGATFLATVAVLLLSRLFAVRKKCPVTIFLISGIFSLVPGAGVYWAVFYMVTDQLSLSLEAGLAALKAAGAIVLGIVCVFELPQKVFRAAAGQKEGEKKPYMDATLRKGGSEKSGM